MATELTRTAQQLQAITDRARFEVLATIVLRKTARAMNSREVKPKTNTEGGVSGSRQGQRPWQDIWFRRN
jgi:hypothetical protein